MLSVGAVREPPLPLGPRMLSLRARMLSLARKARLLAWRARLLSVALFGGTIALSSALGAR